MEGENGARGTASVHLCASSPPVWNETLKAGLADLRYAQEEEGRISEVSTLST